MSNCIIYQSPTQWGLAENRLSESDSGNAPSLRNSIMIGTADVTRERFLGLLGGLCVMKIFAKHDKILIKQIYD